MTPTRLSLHLTGEAERANVVETHPMSDSDLDVLRTRLATFAAARDWEQFHTPKNLAMALAVEAGELMEIFQWLTPEQAMSAPSDPDLAARIRDEVADILSYLIQFTGVCGIDPLAALAAKIDRNESRFPVPAAPDVASSAGGEAS